MVFTDEDDGTLPIRHLTCEPMARVSLRRRTEATRAVQGVTSAIAAVPSLHQKLCSSIAMLPDAIDVVDALTFLDRVKLVVELDRDLVPQQRKVALALFESARRRLVR